MKRKQNTRKQEPAPAKYPPLKGEDFTLYEWVTQNERNSFHTLHNVAVELLLTTGDMKQVGDPQNHVRLINDVVKWRRIPPAFVGGRL